MRPVPRHGQRRNRDGNGGRTDWQPRQHGHGRTDLRGRSGSRVSPGAAAAGGLIGSITGTGAITASYWDTDTSARTNAIGSGTSSGIAGLTTGQMQAPANFASTYAGWDFATVWSAPSAGYYPQLYGVNYVLRVDPANASRVYGDANPAFTYSIYGLMPAIRRGSSTASRYRRRRRRLRTSVPTRSAQVAAVPSASPGRPIALSMHRAR